MAAFPLPTPTGDEYSPPLSPAMAELYALFATVIAAVVILFAVLTWREWRAARESATAACICGHGRLDHKGYDERFECLHCRCRHYIRKAPDKDWNL